MTSEYTIEASDGSDIGVFLDFLDIKHPEIFDLPKRFDIITGATSLVSDGKPPKIQAILEFDSDGSETIELIENIIAMALTEDEGIGASKIIIKRRIKNEKK